MLLIVGCTSEGDPASSNTPAVTHPATITAPSTSGTVDNASPSPEPTVQLPPPTATSTGRYVTFEENLAQIDYSLPLTIQHHTSHSAWMFFELEEAAQGELFYWIENREDLGVYSVPFDARSRSHLIELLDLQSDTHYRVQVGLSGQGEVFRAPGLAGEPWGEISLHTYPDDLDHLRVAVIGDSGFGESITYALVGVLASMEPDFVIHTGDVVYSVSQQSSPLEAFQKKYFKPFQGVLQNAPVYSVAGNHEYYGDTYVGDVPFYYSIVPPLDEYVNDGSWLGAGSDLRRYFAIRLMGYQFIFLDSQQFYLPVDVTAQTEWLVNVLSEYPGSTIGAYHIATYSSGRYPRDGLPIRQYWLPYFQEADTVLMLSGHDHNYQRLMVDGLAYIVSGGGSTSLYNQGQPYPGSQFFNAESHFVILDIFTDRIEVRALNAFGEIFDEATITIGG